MSANILFLHSGDGERGRVEAIAAAMIELGASVVVQDLDRDDYDRILDAVGRAETVIHWPAASAN